MVKFPKLTELYTDLPGFPNLNTIEKPKQHVPIDYDAEKDSQKKQQEQEYNDHVVDVLTKQKDYLSGLPTNTEALLRKVVEHIVKEEIDNRAKTTPFFNGIDGKSNTPKGGSEAFEKSREEVFDDLYDDEGKIKYE